MLHGGAGDAMDTVDTIVHAEELEVLRGSLAFRQQHLALLVTGRRASRANEIERLLSERLQVIHGERTFASVVAEAMRDGLTTRTVENRLRQRYVRALRDLLLGITGHQAAVVEVGQDPLALRMLVLRLFSDRPSSRGQQARPA